MTRQNKKAEESAKDLTELRFLLELVCSQDWGRLPPSLVPIWFEPGGQDQYCTDKPMRVVMSCLEHKSEAACLSSSLRTETMDVLWEIQALLMFANEYVPDCIFELPFEAKGAAQCFWRAVGRLCCLALQDSKLREIENCLNFDHFVETYSWPATDEDLRQFRVR